MTNLRLLCAGALLILPALLTGCGGSSGANTLTVTCNGSTAVAGVQSITISGKSAASGTVLQFPDPVNEGHTGTLPVAPDSRCTIAPAQNAGG
jgi:hypothetical protein